MASGRFDVAEGARALQFDLLGTQFADGAGGHPHSEHSGFDRRPWGDDGTGSDQGILAYFCAVEDDRADPDERTVCNATAVHDRTMAHRDLVAEKRREAICRHVQCRLILDIGSFADLNSFDVASKDRAVENARIGADLDIADDGCPGRNPHTFM